MAANISGIKQLVSGVKLQSEDELICTTVDSFIFMGTNLGRLKKKEFCLILYASL